MDFSENLKQARKQRGLSQEELAEKLNVSRQAVSKWEQGGGYPEVDTLLLLAKTLHVSLDALMGRETPEERAPASTTGQRGILITSPYENVIVTCYKVASSQVFGGGKDAPKYTLFGVGLEAHPFWGQPNTFLGWYASREDLDREIRAIQDALTRGLPTYELKYSVRVERKGLRMKVVRE